MNKICFVSNYCYPLFNSFSKITFGGSEVQIYNFSRKLAKDKNYAVSVVMRNYGDIDMYCSNQINLYNYYSLDDKKWNFIKSPLKFYRTLKDINPDIVICRANGLGVFYSLIYKILNRKKLIYMIAHDGDLTGKYFRGFIGKLFYIGIRFSDFLIAQNQFQYDFYKQNMKRDNISIIKNSFFLSLNKVNNKNTILFVSRADDWKRPELFLKLAKLYPNECFVMIMNKGNDIDIWEKYSKLTKKEKNIKFIEKVSFKDVQKYFDEAKLFVNTSVYEGFPNTFIQACLGKTPILSFKVNPNNFITKNNLGLVANNNFKQFVKDFDKILNDEKLWKSMSNNAFEYVKANHDIDKNIIKLEKVFEKIS